MIEILYPATRLRERSYIVDVIVGEFLGLEYQCIVDDRDDVQIRMSGLTDAGTITLPDTFFSSDRPWLSAESLPPRPLCTWTVPSAFSSSRLVSSELPILYGDIGFSPTAAKGDVNLHLPIDIFGSSFFLLTRYEELVVPLRDSRGRFPAAASIAYQENFLHRPLVNEYAEVLFSVMKLLWPRITRASRQFAGVLSHDVDWPLCIHPKNNAGVLRSVGADLAMRRDPGLAFRRIAALPKVRAGQLDADVCNTFDYMMDVAEANNLCSAFYFIAGHTGGNIDGAYQLSDPWIGSLMRRVESRGHEVGLHPSYCTFNNGEALNAEWGVFQAACDKLGIRQERWGGRQHYLRWDAGITWRLWDEAGLDYDATVGFADHVGFRTGSCFEFPCFDLASGERLKIRERPLVVMEGTLFGYMRCNNSEAQDWIRRLLDTCRQFDGQFSLLWHNNSLLSRAQRRLFEWSVGEFRERRAYG